MDPSFAAVAAVNFADVQDLQHQPSGCYSTALAHSGSLTVWKQKMMNLGNDSKMRMKHYYRMAAIVNSKMRVMDWQPLHCYSRLTDSDAACDFARTSVRAHCLMTRPSRRYHVCFV